jgi:hypothetical protein
MKVIDEVEHEDGSATYTFDMAEEERRIMVDQGILWSIVAGATGETPESVLVRYISEQAILETSPEHEPKE